MRLSAASAAVVPDQVQAAIDRTQELKRKVQIKKQESEGGPTLILAFTNYDGANQIVPNGANDPTSIQLANHFAGGGITYTVVDNGANGFITYSAQTQTITINPAPADSGANGTVTVTATRNGKSTTASFNYDVQ
ncbi:hypothetical protein [Magnetospirillum sp. SS-4]|uniref:hypothetical protein n=1 Tax=Magnetospirillum sp. SS-4 TaxID=2681465 RepID=UPI00137E3879|nr:hypothetical protein [Magnetospirillum sp. SS-4]CAA7625677.1 hypothetical protein MTBSS4_520011 [Magnetospirillum sp. SS-4]